jgi:hypothetical protein
VHRLLVRNSSVEWSSTVTGFLLDSCVRYPAGVSNTPQDVCDELRGLISGQALTYQRVEEPLVDRYILLLLDVEITHMALNEYEIVIISVCER